MPFAIDRTRGLAQPWFRVNHKTLSSIGDLALFSQVYCWFRPLIAGIEHRIGSTVLYWTAASLAYAFSAFCTLHCQQRHQLHPPEGEGIEELVHLRDTSGGESRVVYWYLNWIHFVGSTACWEVTIHETLCFKQEFSRRSITTRCRRTRANSNGAQIHSLAIKGGSVVIAS